MHRQDSLREFVDALYIAFTEDRPPDGGLDPGKSLEPFAPPTNTVNLNTGSPLASSIQFLLSFSPPISFVVSSNREIQNPKELKGDRTRDYKSDHKLVDL